MTKFLTITDAEATTRGTFGIVTEAGTVIEATPDVGGAGSGTVTSVTGTAPIVITGVPTVTPNVTLAAGFTPDLIFPTIAAMAAFDTTTPTPLPFPGQKAFVQSNGSWWQLVHDGSIAADGITVVQGTPNEPDKWLRQNVAGYLAQALKQLQWHIDPANGAASDENTGLTAGAPLIHVAEVYRRYGYTWEPDLDAVSVAVIYHSQNGADDPALFAPNLINGATFGEVVVQPAAGFTGTLLAVTPKNRPGNSALHSTFTTTTGAVAASMLLINTTRGNSRAIALVDTAGNWLLSQPLAQYVSGLPAAVAEVDTWANGDAIQGFNLNLVNVGRIGGRCIDFTSGLNQSRTFQGGRIVDPQGVGNLDQLWVDQESVPLIVDTIIERQVITSSEATAASSFFLGVQFLTQAFFDSNIFNSPVVRGGALAAGGNIASTSVCELNGDFVSLGTLTLGSGLVADGLYLDGPSVAILNIIAGQFSFGAPIYGAAGGVFDTSQGTSSYNAPASTALPFAGTIFVASVGSVYSNATVAGLVTTHKVPGPITAALLDAAAGAAGYGGLAYVPGVAALNAAGVVP